MESVTVLESNPHLFVESIIDHVRDGYYVTNTNAGYILEGVLKEITLTQDPERVFDEIPLGEINLSEYDAQEFLSKLCHAVAVGAVFNTDSLVWDMVGRKSITGSVYKLPEYTKEQLANMDWENLKQVCKDIGFTGRDRTLLTSKYLYATGQGNT